MEHKPKHLELLEINILFGADDTMAETSLEKFKDLTNIDYVVFNKYSDCNISIDEPSAKFRNSLYVYCDECSKYFKFTEIKPEDHEHY